MIHIEIANQQRILPPDRREIRAAVRAALATQGICSAEISIALVDDARIHELNRQYLAHDYATDVLSFVFDREEDQVDGEVIVSAETALRVSQELGVLPEEELRLYVIHGTLHLAGLDDQTAADARRMRAAEQDVLERLRARSSAARTSESQSAGSRSGSKQKSSHGSGRSAPSRRRPG